MKSFLKPLLLGFLILVLMVPLAMIEELVRERSSYRTSVSNEIAQTGTRPQVIYGPWLVVEYQVSGESKQWDKEAEQYVMTTWTRQKQMLLRPRLATTSLDLDVSRLKRSIYEVPVFTSQVDLEAEFDITPLQKRWKQESNPVLEAVSIEVGVADARGFTSTPMIDWNGNKLSTRPGVTTRSRTSRVSPASMPALPASPTKEILSPVTARSPTTAACRRPSTTRDSFRHISGRCSARAPGPSAGRR